MLGLAMQMSAAQGIAYVRALMERGGVSLLMMIASLA